MTNKELANKIFSDLNAKGADLGNVSIILISNIINKHLSEYVNIVPRVLANNIYKKLQNVLGNASVPIIEKSIIDFINIKESNKIFLKLEGFRKFLKQDNITENSSDYLKWKRKNVSYRGIKSLGVDNGVYGSFGKGLYTAALSNKALAKKYGELYFVINGRPKNPKVVHGYNAAEIFVQGLIEKYNREHDIERYSDFYAHSTIEDEALKLGYDGLEISGAEYVNYKPDMDKVRYFKTEDELKQYYEDHIQNINENSQSNLIPLIFTHTIYRMPTDDELLELDQYNLTAEEIINGLKYTIIGKGIASVANVKMIIDATSALHKMFPDNGEYEKAFSMSNKLRTI